MAPDPTPLLSSQSNYSDGSETKTPTLKKQPHPSSSLDETIERCIGDFGWAQFLQAFLVSFTWAFDAQQTFISVFTDAQPTWHCTTPLDSCNAKAKDVCQLPKDSWAWDFPGHTSVLSEWALECAGSVVTGLPASSFFMGCLAGGFVLATLADSSLGRKKMLLLSCLIMSLAGLLTVISTNIWMYSAFRFLSGVGRSTIGTCALVLSTELVGKRWRGQVGIIGFICFTLGFLSLPAVAYLNRGSSWRILYLWTCVPPLFYCFIFHFFVRESPRWLYVRGHKEEFVATLKNISSSSSPGSLSFTSVSSVEQESWNVDLYSAINILLTRKWAFRRLTAVMMVGFGIGMVYYGMPLGVDTLAFNLYLSVTLNALSELPASLITFFLIDRLNRRISVMGFTMLSGVCSLMCVMVKNSNWNWNRNWKGIETIGLELVSFFSACTAFNVLLIYTLELFPTCVRNSAVSMVRQAIVFGGILSPVLAAAGRQNGFLSYGVFGMTIAFCGLFVVSLPETRGGNLCDTLDEEEQKQTATAAALNNGVDAV